MATRSKDMEGMEGTRRVEVDIISSNRLVSKEEAWVLPVQRHLVLVVVCSVACCLPMLSRTITIMTMTMAVVVMISEAVMTSEEVTFKFAFALLDDFSSY
jgi:hypothetical protein